MVFDTTIADPLARVQAFWDLMQAKGDQTFDTQLYPHIQPLTSTLHTPASPTRTTFSLHVHPSLTNSMRNLHGGAAALIFDLCTSVALAPVANGDFWTWPGVSRTLDVVYHKPVPQGAEVRVVCEVVSVGRRMAHIRGEIRRWVVDGEDGGEGRLGEVLVTSEHGKVGSGGSGGAKI